MDGSNDDLNGVFSSKEMDQLECLLDNADGNLLLTVAAATCSHKHVDQTLNDRALNFLEFALLIAAGGVRDVNLLLNSLDLEV